MSKDGDRLNVDVPEKKDMQRYTGKQWKGSQKENSVGHAKNRWTDTSWNTPKEYPHRPKAFVLEPE